jgi:hypothetical protein
MKNRLTQFFLIGFVFCAIAAMAAPPVQYALDIPAANEAVATEWTVPLLQYGSVLTWQALGAGSAETVELKHISTYAAGKAVTNTVETAAARNTIHVYPTEYVQPLTYAFATSDVPVTVTSAPPKPLHVQPGDKLAFKLSATNATTTIILKTTLLQ